MLNEIKDIAQERAWDIVLALVGGYIAIKDIDTKTKVTAFFILFFSVVFSFSLTPVLILYAQENGYISQKMAVVSQPLAILLGAALSLKILDLFSSLLGKVKDFSFTRSKE